MQRRGPCQLGVRLLNKLMNFKEIERMRTSIRNRHDCTGESAGSRCPFRGPSVVSLGPDRTQVFGPRLSTGRR